MREGRADREPVWAVVVAGGSGTRFGRPKQFAELAGRPVVAWSVDAARAVADGVVLVLPAADVVRAEAGAYGADRVVAGGPSRSASVRCGLAAVPDDADRRRRPRRRPAARRPGAVHRRRRRAGRRRGRRGDLRGPGRRHPEAARRPRPGGGVDRRPPGPRRRPDAAGLPGRRPPASPRRRRRGHRRCRSRRIARRYGAGRARRPRQRQADDPGGPGVRRAPPRRPAGRE